MVALYVSAKTRVELNKRSSIKITKVDMFCAYFIFLLYHYFSGDMAKKILLGF